VTGYWRISSKHSLRDYRRWFRHTLRLNAPYVVYHDSADVEALFSQLRSGLPTTFVLRPVSQFETWPRYNASWTHTVHVPSPQLGAIWIEKVALLAQTAADPRFRSLDWFAWVDAGIAFYRDHDPPSTVWPLAHNLQALPRDKLIYTGTWADYHDVAGTAFLCHRNFTQPLYELFYDQLARCAADVNDWRCGNDQYLFTALRHRAPQAFFRIGDGYGTVVPILFEPFNATTAAGTVLPPAPPPPGPAAAAEHASRHATLAGWAHSLAVLLLGALPLMLAALLALKWRRRAAGRQATSGT
jgi:hypothetical protein